MTRVVGSWHVRTCGSSAIDESMSTTEMSIATVRFTAVILLVIVASSRSIVNVWVSLRPSYSTKVPRSSPAPTAYSVDVGIRDGWHGGRRC
jgi:hypothetical protein